jgi:hypothetical protein
MVLANMTIFGDLSDLDVGEDEIVEKLVTRSQPKSCCINCASQKGVSKLIVLLRAFVSPSWW